MWTSDLLKEHYDGIIFRIENRLEGFPQTYALRSEFDGLREALDRIRTDYIPRSEFSAVAGDYVPRHEIDDIKERQLIGDGRRGVLMMLTSVAVTLSVALLGIFIADRAGFSNRVRMDEDIAHAQSIEIAKLKEQIADLQRHTLNTK